MGLSFVLLVQVFASEVQAKTSVEATRFAVTSGHPAATAAGLAVLEAGGNVMDAAVTTSLALGVAAPFGSGLGGKSVMLYRDGRTGEVTCVEALPAAPSQLDPEQFAQLPYLQQRHGYAPVCVPGLPAGLWQAHARWGSLPWRDVVLPAVKLAERGVHFRKELEPLFAMKAYQLKCDDEARNCYLVDGETPHAGDVLHFADLAATLRLLASDGIDPFYRGALAKTIVKVAREGGSSLTLDDFRTYQPHFVKPLEVEFCGRRIVTCPPPFTGGVTVLAALKTLEDGNWSAATPREDAYIDTVSRVLFHLYPRVDRRIGDTGAAHAAAGELLSPNFIGQLRAISRAAEPDFTAARAAKWTVEPTLDDERDADTSHLVIADSEGNIVCMTQSLSCHFGASVVVPGTGVLLNNSMNNFNVINRRSVNALAPGKRPRSAISPVIVERNGVVEMAFGIPGGQRIPSTTIQLLLNVIVAGEPLTDAMERWRFHLRRPIVVGEPANIIDLEEDAPERLTKRLASRGWMSVEQPRDGTYFGGGNGVQYLDNGHLVGVADSRRANTAGGK